MNASKYVQKHYFTLGWCKTSCCICTNIIIARIKNMYEKRNLIKKILIPIWGFCLSILCDITYVSDKLSGSTCSLRDVKVETHRCEVWFEFNDFSQIGQSRLGLPHCQKHCGSAVVSHVVLRISVWQTGKEGWPVRKVCNFEVIVQKWSVRYFSPPHTNSCVEMRQGIG